MWQDQFLSFEKCMARQNLIHSLSLKKLDVVSRNDLVVDFVYCNLSSSEPSLSNCSSVPYSQFRPRQLYLLSPHCPVSRSDLVALLTLLQALSCLSQGTLHMLYFVFCPFSSLVGVISSSMESSDLRLESSTCL